MADLVVHDFAGHPFQVQLSRDLARRGHRVHHVYGDEPDSPSGDMVARPNDHRGFELVPLPVMPGRTRSPVARVRADLDYRRRVREALGDLRADAVISANTPLLSQEAVQRSCEASGARSLYWYQDSYAVGLASMASGRLGRLGPLVSSPVHRLEAHLLRRADAVVAIAPAFVDLAVRAGAAPERVVMIRNWSPLAAESCSSPAWKLARGLGNKRVVLYSGTLGLKHNPKMILALADGLAGRDDVVVVVVSQGSGRRWLEDEQARRPRPNLELFDFEPAHAVPEMLAAADLAVLLLEEAAGSFSVPSKLLSYLAAGRPVVASVPEQNDAAAVLTAAEAGMSVSPGDETGLVAMARELVDDPDRLARLGANASRYALEHFDIEHIGERFESLLLGGARSVPSPAGAAERRAA